MKWGIYGTGRGEKPGPREGRQGVGVAGQSRKDTRPSCARARRGGVGRSDREGGMDFKIPTDKGK